MKKHIYLTISAALFIAAPAQAQSALGGTGGVGTTTGGGFGSGGVGGIGSGGIGVGSGASFAGGNAFSGGFGFQGVQIQPLMKTMGGTTVPSGNVSTTNPFRDYYANPLAAGVPQGVTPQGFGSPVYGSTATTGTTTRVGGATGTGTTATTSPAGAIPGQVGGLATTTGVGGVGVGGAGSTTAGFSTTGQFRAPIYSTVPGYGVVVVPRVPTRTLSRVRTLVSGHPHLPSHRNIRVSMAGPTVVLRGQVGDHRERRIAANLIRLTPGVRGVRNELTVAPKR